MPQACITSRIPCTRFRIQVLILSSLTPMFILVPKSPCTVLSSQMPNSHFSSQMPCTCCSFRMAILGSLMAHTNFKFPNIFSARMAHAHGKFLVPKCPAHVLVPEHATLRSQMPGAHFSSRMAHTHC